MVVYFLTDKLVVWWEIGEREELGTIIYDLEAQGHK